VQFARHLVQAFNVTSKGLVIGNLVVFLLPNKGKNVQVSNTTAAGSRLHKILIDPSYSVLEIWSFTLIFAAQILI